MRSVSWVDLLDGNKTRGGPSMSNSTTGGGTGRCLCGAVQYRYEGEPTTIGLCQCERCQRQSGSAFLIGVVFPREAVTIVGKLASYEATVSGRPAAAASLLPG